MLVSWRVAVSLATVVSGMAAVPQDGPTHPAADADCECMPYYLCQKDSTIVIINDGTCENYVDVCCKKPYTVEQAITPASYKIRGCGHRNLEGVGFHFTAENDNEAEFGEFPWMVAIFQEETVNGKPEKQNTYKCGGSLIHREAVLTAAHCVSGKDATTFKIRAGEWDIQTKSEIYSHQDRRVKEIISHENYHTGSLYNDIAILLLEQPVDIAENVDVVCLPDRSTVVNSSHCYASGWGTDMFGKEGKYQIILKKVELPIVQHNDCQEAIRRTRLGPYYKLHKTFICAGGLAGQDTCKGDGGSPLVCPQPNDPNIYEQVGIVSWGIGCGEDGTPGVYANVVALRNWIDEQMVYNSLDIRSYLPLS